MTAGVFERLRAALLDLDKDGMTGAVNEILRGGEAAGGQRAVDAIAGALRTVGQRFQDGEWFVGELVYAGTIAKEAMGMLAPLLSAGAQPRLGTIVVGTVAGDLHDLGKNIFADYARAAGFEIVDLGVDVGADRFAAAAEEHRPLAVGLSCLLTITAGEVRKTVDALRAGGVRERVKVIVGGAALTEQLARESGADAFAPDAVTGTDTIKAWSGA